MKTKLMIIMAMIGIMLAAVSCETDNPKKEDEEAIVEKVKTDLTLNDWKSVRTEKDGATEIITRTRTLHFTSDMAIVTNKIQWSYNGMMDEYQNEYPYNVSVNADKSINISVSAGDLTYSKTKLSGFWGSNYFEFLAIPRKN